MTAATGFAASDSTGASGGAAAASATPSEGPLPAHVRVAIIGAGFSGVGAAIRVRRDPGGHRVTYSPSGAQGGPEPIRKLAAGAGGSG